MCFFLATLFATSLSDWMNWSPPYNIDAVPNRNIRPPEVTGLLVPYLWPASAVVRLPRYELVMGRFVPGRAYPEIGRPELDIGLMF